MAGKQTRLGPNGIVGRMRDGDVLTRQIIKGRSVFFFQRDLRTVREDIVRYLIGKEIVIPVRDGLVEGAGQTYELAKAWRS